MSPLGEATGFSPWKGTPTYLRDISTTVQILIEKEIQNRILTVAIPELKSTFEIVSDILKPFGRTVRPENNCKEKLDEIPEPNDIQLPISSYHTMIRAITSEIRKNHLA